MMLIEAKLKYLYYLFGKRDEMKTKQPTIFLENEMKTKLSFWKTGV